jgi:hypothetical protein
MHELAKLRGMKLKFIIKEAMRKYLDDFAKRELT